MVGNKACPLFRLFLKNHLPILLDQDDVGVKIADDDAGAVPFPLQKHFNIQGAVALLTADLDLVLIDVLLYAGDLLRLCLGHHAHLKLRFPHDYASGGGSFQPLEPPGVGHNDAFYVLDDIAADIERTSLRQASENLPALGRGIGHRHRLGAAHGRKQLLIEDGYIVFIFFVSSFHYDPPLC